MSPWTIAALCGAGALGAVARLVVDGEVGRRWPTAFPWATLLINVTGSLLLGVLAAASSHLWYAVVGTGFCGGYTTFSTAMVETVRLVERRARLAAAAYAAGSVVACTAVAALGFVLAG